MNVLEQDEVSHILSWPSDGDGENGFVILDKKGIEAIIMPKYFNTCGKYSSFSRRLRRWGFRIQKLHGGKLSTCFHPMFIRGQMKVCEQMTALPQARSKPTESEATIGQETPNLSNDSSPLLLLRHGRNQIPVITAFQKSLMRRDISPPALSMHESSSMASIQRRRMLVTGGFPVIPSMHQQNSPTFALNNLAYLPQHQQQALIMMRRRRLVFHRQPYAISIHGVIYNNQQPQVFQNRNRNSYGGELLRSKTRSEDDNSLALALIEMKQTSLVESVVEAVPLQSEQTVKLTKYPLCRKASTISAE